MKNGLASKLAKGLSGAAGQYFVAAELSRRGLIATVTLRNARGVDVLASNASATRTIGVQVKTNQFSKRKWLLHSSAESLKSPDLFYIFVNLNGLNGTPTYHIVESSNVAADIRRRNRQFLKGLKKDGSARKATNMRVFRDEEGKHLSAWECLGF